jgi:hypothetical protein
MGLPARWPESRSAVPIFLHLRKLNPTPDSYIWRVGLRIGDSRPDLTYPASDNGPYDLKSLQA